MRKFVSVLAVLGLAAAAGAQTLDPGRVNCKDFHDGTAESRWKVRSPTTTGDFFSVDFDDNCAGETIIGVCVTNGDSGAGAAEGVVGVFRDNLAVDATGTTPDIGSPYTQLINATGNPFGGGCNNIVFDTPDVTLPSSGAHIAYTQAAGDSTLWLCADSSSAAAGNSYFTTNSYASPAIPFTVNWMLGLGRGFSGGTVLVNGGSSAKVFEQGAVSLTFVSDCQMPALVLFCLQVVPLSPVYFPFALPTDATGFLSISGSLPCLNSPVYPIVVNVSAIYTDPCDPKPNGRPKVKLSSTAVMTICQDPNCTGKGCFGLNDDMALDSTIWKVQNPAGSGDWFNVRHTDAGQTTGSCTLTGVEVASWDFCGATQSWANVGAYGSNLGLDASGGTPDTNAVVSSVSGASATLAPNASDWTYPATFYDVPDVHLDSTTIYHGAVQWQQGDTCVWLGSDTDASDDDGAVNCGILPNSTSFFTADGYATAAVPFTTANWMIKLDWQ